jgi:glycosyltransferase involved in cell wall biosynthesis
MLVNNLSASGGYQKLVLRLSRELCRLGHEVIIVTVLLDRQRCYPDDLAQLNIIALSERTLLKRRILESAISGRVTALPVSLFVFFRLAQLIRRDQQVLVIHDDICLQALFFARLFCRRKSFWMLNNELPPNLETRGAKTVVQENGAQSLRGFLKVLPRAALTWLRGYVDRSALRDISRVAVYDSGNKLAVERRLRVPATVVSAGADIERITDPSARMRAPVRPFRILSVGVLFPHRRYEDIVRAVSLLQREGCAVEATIVGLHSYSPEYAQSLTTLATQLGCDTIAFVPYASTEDLERLWATADAFVFVNDGKTWGIAVFEAIAAGLPVVITSNIGAAELLSDSETALVVEPKSPDQIANAIRRLMHEPVLRAGIARRAQTQVLPMVTWTAFAKRFEKFLEAS